MIRLSSPESRRWFTVAALLLLAALLRVATSLYHEISGDDATVALMAKHILSGETFPIFFYRQTYMGSLNGAHLVPALFLFGPSVLLVRLNAVFYSLIFPLGLYLLGRRVFDEATARVALLLAALPPFLLIYWSTVAEPHFETNIFGVLLLLLALAAIRAQSEPRYVRVTVCLGLTAGLAFWTSFKALEILVPVLLVLMCRPPRFPLRRSAASFAGGVFLGGLPAWLFYLTHGDPATQTVGSARRLFEVDLTPSAGRLADFLTIVVPTLLGTYYWPAETSIRRAALLVNIGVYATASAAAVIAALRPRHDTSTGQKSGLWLLLLTLGTPFAMVYGWGLVSPVDHETARYVLPVYIPLLLFVGAFVARLWRRSRLTAAVLLAFLIAFNLWTDLTFVWPLDHQERARRAAHIASRQAVIRSVEAAAVDALYVDDQFASLRLAFELKGIPVSDLSDEIYPPNALAADGAGRVAILAQRHHARLEESLAALGTRFAREETPLGRLYTDFTLDPQGYREIAPAGWTATAWPHPELAPHAVDRDAGTRWESQTGKQPGMWFHVDLGQVHRIGMVAWLPGGFQDVPAGFRLEASADGIRWAVLREVRSYYGPLSWSGTHPIRRVRWGRVEVRSPVITARYLRITHLGADPDFWWTIREFFAYEAVYPLRYSPIDAAPLVELLRQTGIRKAYADHGVGARLARASRGTLTVLPTNVQVDTFGQIPDVDLLPRFRPRPDVALVHPLALPSAESMYDSLRRAGWDFALQEVSGYRLFTRFGRPELLATPLPPGDWTASGSLTGGEPRALFDGQLGTRWSTPGPQAPGARLRVDLDAPARLAGLALELGPSRFDYPRGLTLELSPDGARWEPVPATPVFMGPLRWAGTHLLRDGVDRVILRFAPVQARALRLTETGRDPVFHWSVAELRLFAP